MIRWKILLRQRQLLLLLLLTILNQVIIYQISPACEGGGREGGRGCCSRAHPPLSKHEKRVVDCCSSFPSYLSSKLSLLARNDQLRSGMLGVFFWGGGEEISLKHKKNIF